MRTHWIAVVSTVFVFGCACKSTPYQPATTSSGKGYSEKRVSPDRFNLKYVANECTPHSVLTRYLRRRAAELTLQYGFRYFTVLSSPSQPTHLDIRDVHVDDAPREWEPVVVEVPSKGTLLMPIQCFKERPASEMLLIDAEDYIKRVGAANDPAKD